jgi:hypothetical protein
LVIHHFVYFYAFLFTANASPNCQPQVCQLSLSRKSIWIRCYRCTYKIRLPGIGDFTCLVSLSRRYSSPTVKLCPLLIQMNWAGHHKPGLINTVIWVTLDQASSVFTNFHTLMLWYFDAYLGSPRVHALIYWPEEVGAVYWLTDRTWDHMIQDWFPAPLVISDELLINKNKYNKSIVRLHNQTHSIEIPL